MALKPWGWELGESASSGRVLGTHASPALYVLSESTGIIFIRNVSEGISECFMLKLFVRPMRENLAI